MLTNEQYAEAVAKKMGAKYTETIMCYEDPDYPIPCDDVKHDECVMKEKVLFEPYKDCLNSNSAFIEKTWKLSDGQILPIKPYTDNADDFDPATDPVSALAWETWLQDNGFIITHSMATDNSYYCGLKICRSLSTSWAKYEGSGETPLLALKAASERFLEENK